MHICTTVQYNTRITRDRWPYVSRNTHARSRIYRDCFLAILYIAK